MNIVNSDFNIDKQYIRNIWQSGTTSSNESYTVYNPDVDDQSSADYFKDNRSKTKRRLDFKTVLENEKVVYVNTPAGLAGLAVKKASVEKYLIYNGEVSNIPVYLSSVMPIERVVASNFNNFSLTYTPSTLNGIYKFIAGTDISSTYTSSSQYANDGYEWFNLGVLPEDIIVFGIAPTTAITTGHITRDIGYPLVDAGMFDSIYSVIDVERVIKI